MTKLDRVTKDQEVGVINATQRTLDTAEAFVKESLGDANGETTLIDKDPARSIQVAGLMPEDAAREFMKPIKNRDIVGISYRVIRPDGLEVIYKRDLGRWVMSEVSGKKPAELEVNKRTGAPIETTDLEESLKEGTLTEAEIAKLTQYFKGKYAGLEPRLMTVRNYRAEGDNGGRLLRPGYLVETSEGFNEEDDKEDKEFDPTDFSTKIPWSESFDKEWYSRLNRWLMVVGFEGLRADQKLPKEKDLRAPHLIIAKAVLGTVNRVLNESRPNRASLERLVQG